MADKKKKSFFGEFKAFITRGNVLDMAIGVVVGASFSKIVNGLVSMIINPFVGCFMGKGSLDSLKTVLTPAVLDEAGAVVEKEVAILWGTWLQTILDFLITAFCVFVFSRIIMGIHRRMDAEKIAAEEKAKQEAEAKAKQEAEAKAAADAKAAEEAAAREEAFRASIVAQETLLGEIRDLLKEKN